AKASPEDILIRISATNRGPEPARLQLLPTVWFRNTWSWSPGVSKPKLEALKSTSRGSGIKLTGSRYGERYLYCQNSPELLFTENETNMRRLYNSEAPQFAKDGINDFVVNGEAAAVNPARIGTKAAARYTYSFAPGQTVTIKLRLTNQQWSETRDPLNG